MKKKIKKEDTKSQNSIK